MPTELWDLLKSLPEELRPLAERYGEALLQLGTDEILGWVELHLLGRHDAAYQTIISRMSNADLAAEGDRLANSWRQANTENAANVNMHRVTLQQIFRIALRLLFLQAGLPITATVSGDTDERPEGG